RGKIVAIKVLKPGRGEAEALNRAALLAEVAVLARLAHPKIIVMLGCTLDVGAWGPIGLITEYAERGALEDLLRLEPPLPLWRRLQFAIDISEGMAWLAGPFSSFL